MVAGYQRKRRSQKYKGYSQEKLQRQLFLNICLLFDIGKPWKALESHNVAKVILAIIEAILLRLMYLQTKKKYSISFPKRSHINNYKSEDFLKKLSTRDNLKIPFRMFSHHLHKLNQKFLYLCIKDMAGSITLKKSQIHKGVFELSVFFRTFFYQNSPNLTL